MAVTKRTRFEVLRRDEFRCMYCGLRAPETGEGLTVDHVVPVALGGSDAPSNLVAACRDCNAGKSSIQPDSPLVESISGTAAAYALGMRQRMAEIEDQLDRRQEIVSAFDERWNRWTDSMGRTMPRPGDYAESVMRWWGMGVPWKLIDHAIEVAMTNTSVDKASTFRYMAGVIYRTIDERELDTTVTPETARTYTQAQYDAMYDSGMHDGQLLADAIASGRDFVQQHIDRLVDA